MLQLVEDFRSNVEVFSFLANESLQDSWNLIQLQQHEQRCLWMLFDNWQLMTILLDIFVSKMKRGE